MDDKKSAGKDETVPPKKPFLPVQPDRRLPSARVPFAFPDLDPDTYNSIAAEFDQKQHDRDGG
jgi:hypothetical protein